MRRRVPVEAAVDGAVGRHALVVDAAVERHAELVHQDLLAGAVRLDVGGVDDLAQLRLDEQMAEHAELHGEVANLVPCRLAAREPARVPVVDHDRVGVDHLVHAGVEGMQIGGGEVAGTGQPHESPCRCVSCTVK
ncbi:MAG: hypothetical protein E6G17_06450 [Actinobacteria bacterium]|nr:MAG: hypothetical protein E6G17_06450 [Actinomycetota bacterium]